MHRYIARALLLGVAGTLGACVAPPTPPALVIEANGPRYLADDRDAFSGFSQKEAWREAFNAHDPQRLVALYDEHALLQAGTDDPVRAGSRNDRLMLLRYLNALAARPTLHIEFQPTAWGRRAGDLHVTMLPFTLSETVNGAVRSRPGWMTFVLARRDGQWRIFSQQASIALL